MNLHTEEYYKLVSAIRRQFAIHKVSGVEQVAAMAELFFQLFKENDISFEVAMKVFVSACRRLKDPSGTFAVVMRILDPGELQKRSSIPPPNSRPTAILELDAPDSDVCGFCNYNHARNPKEADHAHRDQYQAMLNEIGISQEKEKIRRDTLRMPTPPKGCRR
jgi:hypothetical protein